MRGIALLVEMTLVRSLVFLSDVIHVCSKRVCADVCVILALIQWQSSE